MSFAQTLDIVPRGDLELVVSRVFDAPRDLVFKALTTPAFVRRWLLGPDGWSMPVCEIDLRVGGAYRYYWQNDADGSGFGVGGVYKEIDAPVRTVHTELFDGGIMGPETTVTVDLAERGGRTVMTMVVLYTSKEHREQNIATGMNEGMAQSFDRLERVLAGAE